MEKKPYLKELFDYYIGKSLIIFIVTVLTVVFSCVHVIFFKTPMYQSYATVALARLNENDGTGITQNEISLNQKLVATYRIIIKSKRTLNQVIKNLNLPIGYATLNSYVKVSNEKDTEVIRITVQYENAVMAKKITDEIAKVFSEEIGKIYKIENVAVIDEAEVSPVPYNINVSKQILYSAVLGFAVACIIVFILYYFDTTIKTTEEVEEKTGLSILGSMPETEFDNELVVSLKPHSSLSETVKNIRTNLLFSSLDKKLKSILITSSVASEGKSFVSANLGIAFAQIGYKVIIVDCDLRRGRMHKIFNLENTEGLSNLLVKNVKEEYKSHVKKTEIKGLSVLTRGIVPGNPSEILASGKNKELISLLKKSYDLIIFDGAPLCGISDSAIMSELVDKVAIVSAYKKTKIEELQNTQKSLEQFQDKIAGVIVNRMEKRKDRYYHYYD